MFRCCFVAALERNYFTKKWIADQILGTIFRNDYNSDFTVKIFINRYLQHLLLVCFKVVLVVVLEQNDTTEDGLIHRSFFQGQNKEVLSVELQEKGYVVGMK